MNNEDNSTRNLIIVMLLFFGSIACAYYAIGHLLGSVDLTMERHQFTADDILKNKKDEDFLFDTFGKNYLFYFCLFFGFFAIYWIRIGVSKFFECHFLKSILITSCIYIFLSLPHIRNVWIKDNVAPNFVLEKQNTAEQKANNVQLEKFFLGSFDIAKEIKFDLTVDKENFSGKVKATGMHSGEKKNEGFYLIVEKINFGEVAFVLAPEITNSNDETASHKFSKMVNEFVESNKYKKYNVYSNGEAVYDVADNEMLDCFSMKNEGNCHDNKKKISINTVIANGNCLCRSYTDESLTDNTIDVGTICKPLLIGSSCKSKRVITLSDEEGVHKGEMKISIDTTSTWNK